MAAPMMDGDQVIGVIDLESDGLSGFTAADLAQLETLAAEAARVMQRLWTVRHLHGKARQLESLITAGQSLVTKFEQQELIDALTQEARHMMQARAAALYFHDATTGTIHCASLTGAVVTPLPAGDLPLDACLAGAAIHTRRQVAFLDVQSPEFFDLVDVPREPGLRSVLVSPLLFEGEVLAVLAVFTDRPHRFDND
jgi:GAF domain-containing protein